ncbi:hypothetical protein QUF79_26030 [Fictibacillus enclensis]|nr:hypothetical protein [Fictibacillus enclensis]MDM5201491.1 hypothetical protein [Fictibacillus enclensis]
MDYERIEIEQNEKMWVFSEISSKRNHCRERVFIGFQKLKLAL